MQMKYFRNRNQNTLRCIYHQSRYLFVYPLSFLSKYILTSSVKEVRFCYLLSNHLCKRKRNLFVRHKDLKVKGDIDYYG